MHLRRQSRFSFCDETFKFFRDSPFQVSVRRLFTNVQTIDLSPPSRMTHLSGCLSRRFPFTIINPDPLTRNTRILLTNPRAYPRWVSEQILQVWPIKYKPIWSLLIGWSHAVDDCFQNKMEERRSRRIQKIVDGLLPKTMDPKDRASETDLLLQFCLSLSKVSRLQPNNESLSKYLWSVFHFHPLTIYFIIAFTLCSSSNLTMFSNHSARFYAISSIE